MLRKSVFSIQCGLSIAAFAIALNVHSGAFADTAQGSSSSSGSASGAASTSNPSTPTSASGSTGFGDNSNAQMSSFDTGSAGGGSQTSGSANGTAGAASISISATVNSNAAASESGTSKDSASQASATGNAGPAALSVNAQAQAKAASGQLTASASASDGSYAKAGLGTSTFAESFVPGGVTKLLQNGGLTESLSCNSSGTCSQASYGNQTVSVSIKYNVSTGTVSAGSAQGYLNALLNVAATAGWNEISATASASLKGGGSNNGVGYRTSVQAQMNSFGFASVGRSSNSGGATPDKPPISSVTTRIWKSGDLMCASAVVHMSHSRHNSKKFVECKPMQNDRTATRKSALHNWLIALFDSHAKRRKVS